MWRWNQFNNLKENFKSCKGKKEKTTKKNNQRERKIKPKNKWCNHQPRNWCLASCQAVPPSTNLQPSFIVENGARWSGISLCLAGVSCACCVPTQCLVLSCALQPTHGVRVWGAEKVLVLCKCCSAVTKLSVCYMITSMQMQIQHSLMQATMKKGNSTLAKTCTEMKTEVMQLDSDSCPVGRRVLHNSMPHFSK